MAEFAEGQTVVARASLQGMVKGAAYRITEVLEQPFGTFGTVVHYRLVAIAPELGAQVLTIGNGHLWLEAR